VVKKQKMKTAKSNKIKIILISLLMVILAIVFVYKIYPNYTYSTLYYTENDKKVFSIHYPNKFKAGISRDMNATWDRSDSFGFSVRCSLQFDYPGSDCWSNGSAAVVYKKGDAGFVSTPDEYKNMYEKKYKDLTVDGIKINLEQTTIGNAKAWKSNDYYLVFTPNYLIEIPASRSSNSFIEASDVDKVWNSFHLEIAQ
jgi:hypothetical protein